MVRHNSMIFFIVFIVCVKTSDPVRPRTFDKYIYCVGCQGIVRETLKLIKDSRSEIQIEDALSGICNRNFIGYPYMSKTV